MCFREVVDLEVFHVRNNSRLFGSSSKGTQLKWYTQDKFLKADLWGYESIAEYLTCVLLKYTDGVDYTQYHLCMIIDEITGKKYFGCYSDNFLKDDEQLVSVGSLLQRNYGDAWIAKDGKELLDFVVESILALTGLNITGYLGKMLGVDALILNQDRHFRNIALKYKEGKYSISPLFDHGMSLLSDMTEFHMGYDLFDAVKESHAKPFSINFLRQWKWLRVESLVIDYNGLQNELYGLEVDFKQDCLLRGIEVLSMRLVELENIVWKRK